LSVNIRTAKENVFCGHDVKLGGNFPFENGIGSCTETVAQSVGSFKRASEFCSVTVSCGFETAIALKEELNWGWLENLLLLAVRDKRILTAAIDITVIVNFHLIFGFFCGALFTDVTQD
jgi:hypothetical protein